MVLTEKQITRFWKHVDRSGECWLWTGARLRVNGYGCFGMKRGAKWVAARAHRVSWSIKNGCIPAGMWILHRCDNPPCVNPTHLYLGTRRDNVQDMVKKGRVSTYWSGKTFSEDHRRKLSASLRGNMRRLGKSHSVETRQKIATASLGRTHSLATRRKIALAKMGNTHTLGMKHSEDARRKISAALRGRVLTIETRQKLSLARKRWLQMRADVEES